MIAIFLSTVLAFAQEAERPLAIPGPGGEPQSPPAARAPGDRSRNAARLQALRQYQRERLDVRGEVQFHGGGTRVHTGWGGPYWGVSTVVTEPITTSRTWGLYQGVERLDVPDFLGMVGQTDLQKDLSREIKRADRWSNLGYLTAGAGIVTTVVGLWGMNNAPEARGYYFYNNVTTGGLVLSVGGLLGGSIPANKASRLQRYPSASIGVTEAERLADGYNDQLRESLGLTVEDVWAVESRTEQ